MHESNGSTMFSLNLVSGHFTSKPQEPWTDPLMSAIDSDHEQVSMRDGLNGMITKHEQN